MFRAPLLAWNIEHGDIMTPQLLFGIEGFARKEISSMLVIPIGTVMSRLGRCRVKLRHALSHRRRRGTRQTRA